MNEPLRLWIRNVMGRLARNKHVAEDDRAEAAALLVRFDEQVPSAPPPPRAEPICPGEECCMCNGEACQKCGAGCWAGHGQVYCEHDVMERHELPDDAAHAAGRRAMERRARNARDRARAERQKAAPKCTPIDAK
jgi:hypothetical protein